MAGLTQSDLARTYRDPISWLILAVDLFPIVAIFQLGWGATALVFLYWLENLIIGLVTILRMGAVSTRQGVSGLLGFLFIGAFFTFHYGMFCFVHGVFLMAFAGMSDPGSFNEGAIMNLLGFAFSTGQGMTWFAAIILCLQLFLFVRDFLLRGSFRESEATEEMARPYGRIVVLHIALFAGFGLLVSLGEPIAGVLGLILLRTAWGVVQSVSRHREITGSVSAQS